MARSPKHETPPGAESYSAVMPPAETSDTIDGDTQSPIVDAARPEAPAVTETAATSAMERAKSQLMLERQEIESAFASVAERQSRDIPVDVDEILEVLQASGNSLDDLQREVDRQREIRQSWAELNQYPQRVAAHQGAHLALMALPKKRRQLDKDLDKDFKKQHHELHAQEQIAKQAVDRCHIAQSRLIKLVGREVPLPSTEPDAAEHDILAPVVDEMETRAITPLSGVAG